MIATAPPSTARKEEIAELLGEARDRTLLLVDQLDSAQLNEVWSPILSPLAWDLGHIGNFEELWLVQRIGGIEPMRGELGELYDAIQQPRKVRGGLPILSPEEVRPYMEAVRARTLEVLDSVELDSSDPLLADGFVYELIIAHEHQHNETMLQLLQLVPGYEPPDHRPPPEAPGDTGRRGMVEVAGGRVELGHDGDGFSYDNELPSHQVELEPFEIDRVPVTNGDFRDFVEDTGGEAPMYWVADGEGGWARERFGRTEELIPGEPVCHVSFDQAEAFAAWAGKRLPTEAEWEAAAIGASCTEANLDHLAYGCAVAGSYAAGASDAGCLQMFGDVWEWTSSDFEAYPGFRAFPYPEYSEAHFGQGYKVLRGGAWATRRRTIRPTFRNWDLPERRQIFAGFRCARDVGS